MAVSIMFEKPMLKRGHRVVEFPDRLEIHYMSEEFSFTSEGVDLEEVKRFLTLLDGERTLAEIKRACAAWPEEDVDDFLTALDQCWLLAEASKPQLQGSSGIDFILECEDFQRHLERKRGETRLTQELASGEADRRLLYGYSMEYYHVTARAHDCVTPALAYQHRHDRKSLLREFFVEEYRHDELIMSSLLGAGFAREDVENSMPLPYTAALSNMLSSLAIQDPLSFMAVLFIFEGKPWEGDLYTNSLSSYELPEEFVKYQQVHANLNDDGDHGRASREFLSTIEYVSPDEKWRVFQNIQLIMELQLRMQDALYDYYLNPGNPLPRLT